MMIKNGFIKDKKILFFTPYYQQNRGNSTTAKRIVNGLKCQGMNVVVFAYEEDTWNAKWDNHFQEADLYHVLHLKRFAQWFKRYPHLMLEKPYILTSGGTDVNEDLKNPDAVTLMKSVADESCAITVFSENGESKIIAAYPELTDRVYVIPQSVWLPKSKEPAPINPVKGYPKLLLPAGLRPVKDVFFLLEELVIMRETWPELTFSIIGAALDDDVLQEVKRLQAKYDWFYYLEEVALDQMFDVYDQFDIVLNTSISEGQPTSLLEAMYVGKPILARKIPGNESIIEHRKTGLLFERATEFPLLLTDLLQKENLNEQLCQNAKQHVSLHHSVEQEIKQFLHVYHHCLAKKE